MRWLRSDAARAVPPSPSPNASGRAATLSRKSRRVVVTLRLAKGEAILARGEAKRFGAGRNVHPAQTPMLSARMQTQTFERSPWRMLLATLGLAGFGATPALAADGGLMKDVTFGDYGAAASSSELARRVLTPLAFERIKPHLSSARSQPLDLAQERFVVYVPQGEPPPGGYGLLVFVPPWPEAALPKDWAHVLDRRGMIFVSAARSGNDADTLDRRIPLAL